ncbi:MAG: glycosyltransferase family 39 protein, partial [Chloroflexota bacterium]|nr:glycosyltransferase family 39 protein [Chloroflexota bacterium]
MSPTPRRLGLLACLIVALLLRLWHIDSLPPGFHFDEAFEGLEAWRMLTDPTYRPLFLVGNFGVAPINAYANALMFSLFRLLGGEAGPVAMRVTAACFGGLGVIALYGLAAELQQTDKFKDRLSASFPLFAAATLAGMRWHIHFSRIGIEPILVPLLWTGTTWLLLRGWRTGHWAAFAGSGVLLAGSMYAYQGAWVIPFLTAFVALLLLIDRAGQPVASDNSLSTIRFTLRSPQGFGLFVLAGVAFLLFAPLAWFFWQNWDLVFLRPAQLAVVGATGSPADTSLGHNLWATAKMFGPLGAPGDLDPRRNLPGAPALTGWLAVPFYLGLGLAAWRIRRPGYALLLIGLIGLLLPGVFSEYAPHFHRILGAAAPTALLCALGLDWLWQWRPTAATYLRWVSVLLLLLGSITSVRDYFVRWAALPDLYYAFDVGLWQVGQQIAALPPEQPVYLTPRNITHPTLAFALQVAEKAAPVTFDGRYSFPLTGGVSAQPQHYIVIEHEDFRTPLLLPALLPAATIEHEWRDGQGNIYARWYERPANTQPQRPPQYRL